MDSNNNFFRKHLARNDLVSAPMAGISFASFRLYLRDFFDGLTYTELVSVEGVRRANAHSTKYLDIFNGDRPVVVQLFGGNAEAYLDAPSVADKYSNPDAYDINMGCPVKKVIKAGGGCALLRDTENIEKIITNMRKGTDKPFSVKIRVGWDEDSYVYEDILDIAQGCGANALIVHARTKSQMFGGRIHYEALEKIVNRATIPIIGNGDVKDLESYKKMKETGVDGVMIGRAMLHSPWIFKALREGVEPDGYFTPDELYVQLTRMYSMMKQHSDYNDRPVHYLNMIKKFAVWFSRGLDGSAQFRGDIYKDKDNDEKRFFSTLDFFKSNFDLKSD